MEEEIKEKLKARYEWGFEEGYAQGFSDSKNLFYSFTDSYKEKLIKLQLENRKLKDELYELRKNDNENA